jgi:hypothetical protein
VPLGTQRRLTAPRNGAHQAAYAMPLTRSNTDMHVLLTEPSRSFRRLCRALRLLIRIRSSELGRVSAQSFLSNGMLPIGAH